MTPIATKSDLEAALLQPAVMLFLWVDWSVYALQSRLKAEKAIALVRANNPQWSAPCFLADVSEQSGELWDALFAWLSAEEVLADRLMWSGAGSLLWLQAGKVSLHMISVLDREPAKLAAVAQSVFLSDA
jgi:hypothetical protein